MSCLGVLGGLVAWWLGGLVAWWLGGLVAWWLTVFAIKKARLFPAGHQVNHFRMLL
ncbi:MAG: hypothetical protein QM483_04940 [Desulfuromusa sp.]